MNGRVDRPAGPSPGPPASAAPRAGGPSVPGSRERAWLAAYPDRRRLLAARRRRLERALFLEDERAHAWRRLRVASWGLVVAGLLLVGLGVPFRADLAFLAGAVLFLLGGLGLLAERVGQASREERRDRLAERLSLLVRRGDEMDARARRLAAVLGIDPWEAMPRPGDGRSASPGRRLSGEFPR